MNARAAGPAFPAEDPETYLKAQIPCCKVAFSEKGRGIPQNFLRSQRRV